MYLNNNKKPKLPKKLTTVPKNLTKLRRRLEKDLRLISETYLRYGKEKKSLVVSKEKLLNEKSPEKNKLRQKIYLRFNTHHYRNDLNKRPAPFKRPSRISPLMI